MKYPATSNIGSSSRLWAAIALGLVGLVIIAAYHIHNCKEASLIAQTRKTHLLPSAGDDALDDTLRDRYDKEKMRYPDRNGKTPLSLDARWDQAVKNIDSDQERVTALAGIAAALAMEGREFDALEKTFGAFGPGETRCRIIAAIFHGAKNIDALEKCFLRLEQNDEKDYVTNALADRLTFEKSPEKFDFQKFQYVGERLEKLISSTVSTYILQRAVIGQTEISKVFEKSMTVKMSKESEKAIISEVASIEPFSCWEHIAKKGVDLFEGDADQIVTQMVKVDPQKAIERISTDPKISTSFHTAFTEWMRKDASKPIEWLNRNVGKLSAVQADRAYQGIANYAAQQGDLGVAKQWANQIKDEDVRRDLSKESWFSSAAEDK